MMCLFELHHVIVEVWVELLRDSGRVLPEQFWKPNEFGVKGGIEAAFMSTTSDRAVAVQYAGGAPG